MQRLGLAFSMLLSAAAAFACSDGSADGGDAGDSGGATGGSGGSSTGGSSTGGSSTGGSSGATTGGASGTNTGGSGGGVTGGSSTGGASGSSSGTGGSAGGGFTKTGVCGQRSEATVTANTYEGYEEFYMVSEEVIADGRLDEFICLVRFDVTRVGAAPAGCIDLEDAPCEWTNMVEFSNPTVMMNVDGACEKNELRWHQAWMDGIDGTQASYGYIFEYQGHDSVIMKASGTAGAEMWNVLGRAAWTEETGEFTFDNRIGECQY